MKCEYCFRNKNIFKISPRWKEAIDLIADSKKIDFINIAGGEPTLNTDLLIEILEYIKSKNLKSSIVSNGLILSNNEKLLDKVLDYVDILGISIDSLDHDICKSIGRIDVNGNVLTKEKLEYLNQKTKAKGKLFKINVVVSQYNLNDKSLEYINNLNIDRIKILRNQLDNQITETNLKKIKSLFNKCKNIVIECDMDYIYLMLNDNLEISTTMSGKPRSIFEQNILENTIKTLKITK